MPAVSKLQNATYAWWAPPRRLGEQIAVLRLSVARACTDDGRAMGPWAERKDKQGAEPDGDVAGSGRRHPVFGIVGQEIFFCKLTSFL